MITVVGERAGVQVVSFTLDHGADVHGELRGRGWTGSRPVVEGVLERLVIRFAVEPLAPSALPAVAPRPQGPGLTPEQRETVLPRQRVAAYAVVVVDGALLLTQLSGATGAGGRWNLPGGGVDPGESPHDAVVREVAEETGQAVDDVRLVDVLTQHWVGRGVRGLEDYHAVRLVHTARCPDASSPVVHDVGGSTSDARWVPLERLGDWPVVATVPVALEAAGVPWPHPRPVD